MSTLQAAITFKSRKKTDINNRKSKSNAENKNDLAESPKANTIKRQRNVEIIDLDEKDSCSAAKIARKEQKYSSTSTTEKLVTSRNGTSNADEEVNTLRPLPSREKEIEWLQNFLIEHLEKEESGSLYISGQPGTGKTACLSYILQLSQIKEGYKHVYINCTMMKSASSIYSRICKELKLQTSRSSEKVCLNAIVNYLNKNHKMILLVLDEIDQLDSKRQSVLYTIFEWPSLANSRLVLIGVANALDLTERTLPRLQARCSLRPCTFHFAPYSKEQIINVFTTILASEDKQNVFSPVALQMLAAKIASVSGDMRRALDIGKRVIEIAKRSKFSENQCVNSMMRDSTVTVEIKQVLEILNDVYGGSNNIETEVDESFPMQQKLILCTLMLMLTKGKNRNIFMGKLHDVYKRVANARNIAPLDMGEMVSACTLLEARGALRVGAGCAGGAGGARARRVLLHWDEAQLAAALRDKPLLSTILNDVNCLNTRA